MDKSTTKKLAEFITSTPVHMLEHEILRTLVSHNKNVGTKKEDDFLSEQKLCGEKLEGNRCIALLNACINGDNCAGEWANLNWGAGIDWENMDHGAASNLAKKLNLHNESVDDVVTKLAFGSSKTASNSLRMALQAIKNRISPSPINIKPISSVPEVGVVMKRVPTVPMNRVGLVGGGNKGSYANFIRSVDAVKTNISMTGGGNEHASILRSGLSELQELLEHRNKKIHQDDLVRINDLIDILERTENKASALGSNIWALNSALKQDSVLIPVDKKDITLKVIEQLVEESNKVKLSSVKKVSNIIEIFEKLDSITKKLDSIK